MRYSNKVSELLAAVVLAAGASVASSVIAGVPGLSGIGSGTYDFSIYSSNGEVVQEPTSGEWSFDFDSYTAAIDNSELLYGSLWTVQDIFYVDNNDGTYSGTMVFNWGTISIPIQIDWDIDTSGATTLDSDGDGIPGIAITDGDLAGFSIAFDGSLVGQAAPVDDPPVSNPSGPYNGTVGVPVNFDGSLSYDDGSITRYDWDFGDGVTGTGGNPSHTYTVSGIYDVSLTVEDDNFQTDTATTTATIALPTNLPPRADPGGPYSGTVGSAVQFDGSNSSDPDGTIVAYDWDFGDSSGQASAESPSHIYADPGTYSVTLVVTDDADAPNSATTTATITPVSTLDLDIAQFNVNRNRKVGKPIRIAVFVKNNGDVEGEAQAVVTGDQGGAIVYSQTAMVSAAVGDDPAKWDFPSFTPNAPGVIDWTATILDGNTDDDTATATTTVR